MTEQESKIVIYELGYLSLEVKSLDKETEITFNCESSNAFINLSLQQASWLHRVLGEALAMSKEN